MYVPEKCTGYPGCREDYLQNTLVATFNFQYNSPDMLQNYVFCTVFKNVRAPVHSICIMPNSNEKKSERIFYYENLYNILAS